MLYVWLAILGFALGTFGTLIGAGGGFLLVPLLLLLYPHERPEIITSISLAVVFCNAASGSWAYARLGRIDYHAAALFALAAMPGAVLGAMTTTAVPRRLFDALLGTIMVAAAVHLLRQPHVEGAPATASEEEGARPAPDDPADAAPSTTPPAEAPRAAGAPSVRHTGRFLPGLPAGVRVALNPARTRLGMLLSAMVSYVSGLLGIGGGIVHVPLLVRALDFPVHVATATSHCILALMSLSGLLVHVATGTFSHGYRRTAALAVGVVLGAQLGARLSNRLHGGWIIRLLAFALAFVGVRVLLLAMAPLA